MQIEEKGTHNDKKFYNTPSKNTYCTNIPEKNFCLVLLMIPKKLKKKNIAFFVKRQAYNYGTV